MNRKSALSIILIFMLTPATAEERPCDVADDAIDAVLETGMALPVASGLVAGLVLHGAEQSAAGEVMDFTNAEAEDALATATRLRERFQVVCPSS